MADVDTLRNNLLQACQAAAAQVGGPLRDLEAALPDGDEKTALEALHTKATNLSGKIDTYFQTYGDTSGTPVTNSGGGNKDGN